MDFVEPIRDVKKIESIKKHMKADGKFRDLLLFTLGINTGLRISDLLQLSWAPFLNSRGNPAKVKSVVTLKERKTGKIKRFRVNRSVHEALKLLHENLQAAEPEDFLFISNKPSKDGHPKPISRVHAWRVLNHYAGEAGVKGKVGTHTLRKTFGYHLYRKGIAVEYIQKMLNHSSPSVTLRYIGISQDQLDEIYVDLNL